MDGVNQNAAATAEFRALPEPAPLAMPEPSLRRGPAAAPRRLPSAPRLTGLRRAALIGAAIAMTADGAHEMYLVVAVGGLTTLKIIILTLFVVLFAWIAFAFASAVAGFFSVLAGGGTRLGIDPAAPLPGVSSRTALLMPTYNEQPARVMAGLQAIIESLASLGAADAFDVFILSDTTDPDIWIAEEAAFLALRDRLGGDAASRLFYRRRPLNFERKSGNIAEWVRRFGAAYPQMLVLDADSVMAGESIIRLVAAMERHADVGLIQTLPVIVNGSTLFARTQQFAGRVYGPLIAHGVAWWHGADGNYWGHNAVIRTAAFAACAGLPHMPGPRPFGGHILSHDFVEAALLRRGGWAVHMVPGLPGSYEESPPSLTDLAIRDRRWCQGNLLHAGVLPARGLHWVSRLHMFMGIGSYITAPIWLVFLVVGILLTLQSHFVVPNYFGSGRSLFPDWPAVDPIRSKWVFVGTMAVLLAPKLFATLALLFRGNDRRGCGGAIRTLASMLIETLIAGLLAPIAMLNQSLDVAAILLGRDSGWNTQRRDDGSIPLADIARRYRLHTLFGLALAAIAYLVSVSLFLWMLPVVIGLALAIPLVALTASRAAGLALARIGLLRIPEEPSPPAVLARARSLATTLAATEIGIGTLFRDPALIDAHRRMLPPPRRRGQDPLDPVLLVGLAKLDEVDDFDAAMTTLTAREKTAVLSDPRGLARLAHLAAEPPQPAA